MKKKNLNKKLGLNKNTISNLNHIQMDGLHGGYEKTTTTAIPCQYSCDSCRITFCGQETCDCTDTCNSVCSNGGNCC